MVLIFHLTHFWAWWSHLGQ